MILEELCEIQIVSKVCLFHERLDRIFNKDAGNSCRSERVGIFSLLKAVQDLMIESSISGGPEELRISQIREKQTMDYASSKKWNAERALYMVDCPNLFS